MVASNYPAALKRILVHEGGYVNDPQDPGGATMRGVTQGVYDAYRQRKTLPRKSVGEITEVELQAIYRTQYADKIAFDKLPEGVDYCVFDGAVNSGPVQSVKWLQRALGIKADGLIGNVTLAAAEAHPSKLKLIYDITDQRLAFLKALKTWKRFGGGWSARVMAVRRDAIAMANGKEFAPIALMDVDQAAARIPAIAADVVKPAAPVVGPTIGAGGGLLTGLAQAGQQIVDQGKEQLLPFAGSLHVVDTILTGLTVTGIVIAGGGLVYGVVAKFKRDRAKAAIGAEA